MNDRDSPMLTDAAPRGAIVIGGNYGGLGIVRSLGRQGIPVWVLEDDHVSATRSRYARRRVIWPPSGRDKQLEFLLALGADHHLENWVVFPTTDESAALLSQHHDALSARFALTTPPWSAMRWAYDKRLTYELAERAGVDFPWTRYPRGRDEVESLECIYPVVLKPAIKDQINPFTMDRAWPAQNHRELLSRYDRACEFVDPSIVMVQEMISGGGDSQFSFAALCRDGRVEAWGTARRTRQYPVDFGHGSSFVEMIDDPGVEEPSRRIVGAMKYSGLIELEYKQDARSGRFKLLDVNARAWAWHSLGRRAGVDFPFLCWRMVTGEQLGEIRARPGAHWVRMITDVPASVTLMRERRLSVGGYLSTFRRPLEFAVFAVDDPIPALVEIPSLFRRIRQRGEGLGRPGHSD